MGLLERVKSECKTQSGHAYVRQRVVNQIVFLSKTGYFKRKIKAPAASTKDAKGFTSFVKKHLVKKNFAKDAELLILHSLVVTLLIAWGDEPKIRRAVGRALQVKLKLPKLAQALEAFPNFYARFLAHLPPVTDSGVRLTSLLFKAL